MKLATFFFYFLFCVVCRKRQEKMMIGFTEVFTNGSDNFKTSDLSNHDKSKMKMQTINEGTYIKCTKRGKHYHPTL